jgi:hypothetical protein
MAARSRTGYYPGKGLTNAVVVSGHLRRPEEALEFARVVAHRLHVVGGDLQQPAQIRTPRGLFGRNGLMAFHS